MIIWFFAFLIIVAISLILAYLSMKDFPEIPEQKNYGLYLVQNPESLSIEILDLIAFKISKGEIISFERLFKGEQSALVVFGPKEILISFQSLNLLELEDYTKVPLKVVAWEISLKEDFSKDTFKNLPPLNDTEQFWWQVVLQSKKKNFIGVIRAVVLSDSDDRLKLLSSVLQNLNGLVKLPRPYTSEQILDSFKERTLLPLSTERLEFSSQQVLVFLFS